MAASLHLLLVLFTVVCVRSAPYTTRFLDGQSVGYTHVVPGASVPDFGVGTVENTWTLSGGLFNCSNCGNPTEYACSDGIGNWNDGVWTFQDQVPKGQYVIAVGVTLYGAFGCTLTSQQVQFNIEITGTTIGTVSTGVNWRHCECGACDGALHVCQHYPFQGLSSYKYGGENTLTLAVTENVICVNTITLHITYGSLMQKESHPPVSPSRLGTIKMPVIFNTSSSSVSIPDPLPSNTLLISVTMEWLFGEICIEGNAYQLSGDLVGHPISGSEEYNEPAIWFNSSFLGTYEQDFWRMFHIMSPHQCGDLLPQSCTRLVLPESTRYQTGWPDYQYGQSNAISLMQYESGEPNYGTPFEMYSGYLQMTYYQLSQKEMEEGVIMPDNERDILFFKGKI